MYGPGFRFGLYSLLLLYRTLIDQSSSYTVNPLYNDIRYNCKIRYNVNSASIKISGSCIFSLTVPYFSLGKHTSWIFVRIASPRRF